MSTPQIITLVFAILIVALIAYYLVSNWEDVRNYYRETVGELRKVDWPSNKETYNLTIIVLITVILSALFLGMWDYLFEYIIGLLI